MFQYYGFRKGYQRIDIYSNVERNIKRSNWNINFFYVLFKFLVIGQDSFIMLFVLLFEEFGEDSLKER